MKANRILEQRILEACQLKTLNHHGDLILHLQDRYDYPRISPIREAIERLKKLGLLEGGFGRQMPFKVLDGPKTAA